MPLDDAKVYKIFQTANTGGVFQFESDGMRKMLVDIKPTTFDDLVSSVALYRPGPINAGMGKKYADTKVIFLKHIKDKIDNILTHFIDVAQYRFGYHVFQPADNDLVNYNTYSSKKNGRYNYHADGSRSDIFDIKLTLLINISMKPYKGGEFKYFSNQEYEIPSLNIPGNAIVIKSHLNHQVLPITKGERNTLTYFICGPKFR